MKYDITDIPGYGGEYRVDTTGRVQSVKKFVAGTKVRWLEPCAPGSEGQRSRRVTLCHNSKEKKVAVQDLVAQAFLGPCPEGERVNHKDGDKMNDSIENLEYVKDPSWQPPEVREANKRVTMTEEDIDREYEGTNYSIAKQVYGLAEKYYKPGSHITFDDLVSAGDEGAAIGLSKYDPNNAAGASLVTFLYMTISHAMLGEIRMLTCSKYPDYSYMETAGKEEAMLPEDEIKAKRHSELEYMRENVPWEVLTEGEQQLVIEQHHLPGSKYASLEEHADAVGISSCSAQVYERGAVRKLRDAVAGAEMVIAEKTLEFICGEMASAGRRKRCAKCGEVKWRDEFRGYGYCIECVSAIQKEAQAAARKKNANSKPEIDPATKRRCPKCRKTKLVGEFYTDRNRDGGIMSYCISCSKNRVRQWRGKRKKGYVKAKLGL